MSLPWQQDENLYLSHFLRHRKLKFSIQIPPDLRKESFWLLGGFGYHHYNSIWRIFGN